MQAIGSNRGAIRLHTLLIGGLVTYSLAASAAFVTDQAAPAAQERPGGFPKTASAYAKLVEAELGVPPKVDLGAAVEIPLFVDGERAYGNLGYTCDNPTFLGKATVSGSVLQRYEGRTADGEPLPDVVWVAFGRNSSWDREKVVGSVQMIGYHTRTGATAFFESSDRIEPWVTLDEDTWRMRGVLPGIDEPAEFDRAFRTPGTVQCVGCHQADPFITNSFISAAKIPGTREPVVPILDADAPYHVIGGEHWDMRTIHIEDNACFECHRVGMCTVGMFLEHGWHPDKYMPPYDPGSLDEDWQELLRAWRQGPDAVEGASWVVPPARGAGAKVVGEDYPHKAPFNAPGGTFMDASFSKLGKSASGSEAGARSAEVEELLGKIEQAWIREAYEQWIEENGVTEEVLEKLRGQVSGEKGKGDRKKGKGK